VKKTLAFVLSLVLLAAIGFGGCGAAPDTSPAQPAAPAAQEPAQTPDGDASADQPAGRVAVVLGVGGLGDQGFNDLVYAGALRAQQELGVEFDYAEPTQIADFEIIIRDLASSGSYDLIVNVGFNQIDPLIRIASEFPDQIFALIDGVVDAPNVISYISREEEGSFLVGALAGLMNLNAEHYGLNVENTIGFVGAMENPLIVKFGAGFAAGARFVNPDIQVLADFVGGASPFSDPTTAQEIAIAQNTRGANIVYHAAGGSGIGVFQAAAERDFFAIGVNQNQNMIEPDHIIASMLKRVDTATFNAIQATVVDGNPPAGSTIVLGLAEEGVGFTLEFSNIQIDASDVAIVNSLRDQIIAGALVVPETFAEVDAFLAANQFQG